MNFPFQRQAAPCPRQPLTHPTDPTSTAGGNTGFSFHRERHLAGRQEPGEALCPSSVAEGALPLPEVPRQAGACHSWVHTGMGPAMVQPSQGGSEQRVACRQGGLWDSRAARPRPAPSCAAEKSRCSHAHPTACRGTDAVHLGTALGMKQLNLILIPWWESNCLACLCSARHS